MSPEADTPPTLAAALAAFQSAMPPVAKIRTAKVGTFSYTYAGLAEVTSVAAPLLAKQGLSFTCLPRLDDQGRIVLVGKLLHSSGDTLEGTLPISGTTPQQVGSSLTYARRYLLGCMTGIATDDDDDGQLASKATARKATEPTTTVRRQPRADTETPSGAPAAAAPPPGPAEPHAAPQVAPEPASELTDSLRRSLMAATSRLGVDPTEDRQMRLALWSALLARKVTSGSELSRAEALTLLRRMNDCETGAVEWDYSVETGAVTLRHIDREPPA